MKYIISHDTTLFGQSTIPNQHGLVPAEGGYKKGSIIYGSLVKEDRFGFGIQNFVRITTRDKFNGLYVPATAVERTSDSPTTMSSQTSNAKSSANGGQTSGMGLAEKISGHAIGYAMMTGGTLLSILSGMALLKMIASSDPDKKTFNQAIVTFGVGTMLIYIGNRFMPSTTIKEQENNK